MPRLRTREHRLGAAAALVTMAFLGAGCLQQQGPLSAPALVPGVQACLGVPPAMCQEQVALMRQEHPRTQLVAYRIVCTRAAGCNQSSGEATIEALFADGTEQSGGFGWEGAPAPIP